ncbi:hypothetical protein [Pseudobdellovibrio sp. HCB154]|uniref:hypothetical protein n=1 Tax=Pseudobdellovibrio sp. HCB154 TaxID=3386277 RepID=UPI003916D8AF
MRLMNLVFVLGLSLSATAASAAALCPPDSCNVHNGCMDGCTTKTALGVAACNTEDPKAAENEALQNGVNYAYRSCAYSFFLTSKWKVNQVETAGQCEVHAQASFSCFQ